MTGSYGFADLGGGDIYHRGVKYPDFIFRVFVEEILNYFIQVEALSWKDCRSEVLQKAFIFLPTAYIRNVICSHDEGETILRLTFLQGSERSDGVVRFGHIQFYVIHFNICVALALLVREMPFYRFHGSQITLGTAGTADAFLERILGRYDEIYHIKTGLLDSMFYDGEMADM